MKIAILARLDPSISGLSRAGRIAGALAGAGHDVTVVTLQPTKEVEGRAPTDFAVLSPQRRTEPPGPLLHLSADPELGEAAAGLRPDLVVATDPPTLRQATRIPGAAVVYDTWEVYADQVEQTVPERWFRPILVRLLSRQVTREERRRLPRVAGVIFTSEGHRELFLARHGKRVPKAVAIVRNCPPLTEATPDPYLRRATGASPSGRLLVYAGSLGPSRGLFPMLDAMRRLGAGYRLAVVGWGWLEAEMRSRAPENAVILPPVPVERLIGVLAAADAGLLPIEPRNESKRHALANKLFEYLMAGIPVVATDLPEQRRVLEGTEAGVLVPSATPEAVEEGVRRLFATDPAPRRAAARELAETRYNLERETPALLELIEKTRV